MIASWVVKMHDNEIVTIQRLKNEHNELTGKKKVIPGHRNRIWKEWEKTFHIQAIGNQELWKTKLEG